MALNVNDLDAIFIGDPMDAMEAAKRIVKTDNNGHVLTFITIATSNTMRLWSRIAAIWILGHIDQDAISVPDLERIIQNHGENAKIREYATETVDQIRLD